MTEEHTRIRMSDTLDGRKRWYYQAWWIERVKDAYEAHPAFRRPGAIELLAGRTLADVEAKISRAEAKRIREGGTP